MSKSPVLKKMAKKTGAAGAGVASGSAQDGGVWIPSKEALRGAQVSSANTGNAGDNKLHLYIFEYCQKIHRYGARPLGGSCFWECERPVKEI